MKACLYLKIASQICTDHLSYAVIHLQIDKKAMHKVGMVQRVQNEVKIHCQLKHPSILEVSKNHGVSREGCNIYLLHSLQNLIFSLFYVPAL